LPEAYAFRDKSFLCGSVGLAGAWSLHGAASDARLTWVTLPDGQRNEVVWPPGYRARFTPNLEVLNELDVVVAREGSLPTGGCQAGPSGMWLLDVKP
jgi:hypothetical protein